MNTMTLENCILLDYYAASICKTLPTFRDNVSVPSSRVKKFNKKKKAFSLIYILIFLSICFLFFIFSSSSFVLILSCRYAHPTVSLLNIFEEYWQNFKNLLWKLSNYRVPHWSHFNFHLPSSSSSFIFSSFSPFRLVLHVFAFFSYLSNLFSSSVPYNFNHP
jgi:hypothetical protein